MVLFPDAASEMTVSQVSGLPGIFATYLPDGFTPAIVVRHAEAPQGPWSEPITIFRCPTERPDFFVYSAKAHPALTDRKGELVVTYCTNSSRFQDHLSCPWFYFPRAIKVVLAPEAKTVVPPPLD